MSAVKASEISHKKYARIVFNWDEAYAPVAVPADEGQLAGWILNRPGPGVFDAAGENIVASNNDLWFERNIYALSGSWSQGHQPYLWNQIQADYKEYRVYGCKYKFSVKNITSMESAVSGVGLQSEIYVALGITQQIMVAVPTDTGMNADHISNQPRYIEGRHPEWRRVTLKPGKSHVFTGYVNIRKSLRDGLFRGTNSQADRYPWFKAEAAPLETALVGTDTQNQPYYGWVGATIASVIDPALSITVDPSVTPITDVTLQVAAEYGRAPQCCFLYLAYTSDVDSGAVKNLKCSLSVQQYVEFRRTDPVYDQS